MTGSILVPIDGSEKDARALAVAADLARLADASLTVVRVRDAGTAPTSAEVEHAILDAVRSAAGRVGLAVSRGVACEVLDADDVPAALLAKADAMSAAAVVMATRAPQAIGRAIHGSVADRIVREATQPVMLVPPGADFLGGHDVRLRRVLVPVDGSDASLTVLAHLLAFANARELDLVLFRVVPPTFGHSRAEAAETTLNELVVRVRTRGATAEARVVEAEDPAATIAAAIRQDLVDFIAMSTRGAGGVERLVFGSVATAVVRASEVPVLLVTPATSVPRTPRPPFVER
jgi:nucleotide-binding universal stress UspA family protein